MNFRQSLLRFCTKGCGLLLILSLGLLARPAGGAIPGEIKTGPNADRPENQKLIADSIQATVQNMVGGGAEARSKARNELMLEVNAPNASTAFLDAYSKALNDNITTAAGHQDPRIRLNAAIVVARVAERVNNTNLLPITQTLLADQSDAVKMWALKAAKFIVPPLLQYGTPAQQEKFVSDVKSLAASGTMLPLVYEALSLNYLKNPRWPAPVMSKMAPLAVPEVLNLIQARVAQLQKQLPPEPVAEKDVVAFLAYPDVWNALPPPLQLRVVQTLADLVYVAGTHPQRQQLEVVVHRGASAIAAIALTMRYQDVQTAMQQLSRTGVSAAGFEQALKGMHPMLKTKWTGLTPPPSDAGPATDRATTSNAK